MKRPLFSLFAWILLCSSTISNATELHVATDGSDANPGTEDQPFATAQAAQAAVRTLVAAGLTESVDVIFRAGVHHLSQPLELRPEDSGTPQFPITWRAADGESVILSGGKSITGTWTEGADGVWQVDIPETGNGWNFRQLFVENVRAPRARFPNADEPNPFLYATGGSMAHARIASNLVKESWGTATDAQINIVANWMFFNQWNTVTGVNTDTGDIHFADSERHGAIKSGNWFWIEGVREELDQPGEWFLDTTAGRLYYMPEAGQNPNNLTFIAPFLNRIVNAKGDVNADTHVEHVHFSELEFRHTTFTLGHIEARVHTDGAVMFENTSNCRIENCHFEHIGGYALWLHLDSRRNVFGHNTVCDSGGGGVLMTGARFSYMDDSKLFTPGEAAAKVFPILNEVTHNTVERCGKIRYYGGGVHMDSRPFSMSMDPGNYIAHNHFNDLSRNGIFAFRNQGGNVIEYNRIYDAMQTTIDGAGIHFATMNRLNAPNYITHNYVYDIWGYKQQPNGTPTRTLGYGIFLDWASSNMTVTDNYIYNATNPIAQIMGPQNNIISDNRTSSNPITPPWVDEVGTNGTATDGVDLENNRLTGNVIHYTDNAQVTRTGTWTPVTKTGFFGLFTFHVLEAAPGTPAQIQYQLPIPEPGTYQISLLYPKANANASNATVSVQHTDGTANHSWNMRNGHAHGFAVEVGNYRFDPGQPAVVTISNPGADGIVVADSIAFVKTSEDPDDPNTDADGIIIDNTNPKCSFDAPWSPSTYSAGYHGSNYSHDGNESADPAKWAKWTPDIAEEGDYKVYMRWTSHSNRPDAAPLEIAYEGGVDSAKTVNQQQDGDQWNLIGTFRFSTGTNNYVKILASDNGYTIADAVKFVKVPTEFESSWNDWLNQHFPGESDPVVVGLTANPDEDNTNNLGEYVSGGNPNSPDTQPGISMTALTGVDYLVTSRERTPLPPPLVVEWESSVDLESWTDASAHIELLSSSPAGNGFADISYRFTPPPPIPPRLFIRRVVNILDLSS